MEAASTWGAASGPTITKGASGPAWDTDIRGYRQEMEHFAFLVRRQQKEKLPGDELYKKKDGKYVNADALPRCHGGGGNGRCHPGTHSQHGDGQPPADHIRSGPGSTQTHPKRPEAKHGKKA